MKLRLRIVPLENRRDYEEPYILLVAKEKILYAVLEMAEYDVYERVEIITEEISR